MSLFDRDRGDGSTHNLNRYTSASVGGGTQSLMRTTSLGSNSGGSSHATKLIGDQYRLAEELGRGAYGKVFRGIDTRTGDNVAIKQLSLSRLGAEQLTGISNEVELLKALNHRNVVKYLGSFRTKTHLYIIMEYMENGALSSIVKTNRFGPFSESLVAMYVQQVLQGLVYLHEQGVVHRDIKGANILTTRDGQVKLADFGVAAKLGDVDGGGEGGKEAAAAAAAESSPAGTPYWMAPEVVELKTVTTASDIWSVACLAVELLTGQPPYYELQPMSALYNIVQDAHPPLPLGASPAMQDFLLQCFRKDPATRPKARTLLQHPWITHHRQALRTTWTRTKKAKADRAIDSHSSVVSVVERILAAESLDQDSGMVSGGFEEESPKAGAESVADSALELTMPHSREAQARQNEFLERVTADPRGVGLLTAFESLRIGVPDQLSALTARAGCPTSTTTTGKATTTITGSSPAEEAEVLRQVQSLRITAQPGERNLQQEAAAAATARALATYIKRDPGLRAAFIAGDGMSGARELLDSPSERVLFPTLELLNGLLEGKECGVVDAMCMLGVLPAALRLSGAAHPPELRLLAGRLAESLALSTESGAHFLVASQGIPFFIGMIDDAPQGAMQLELIRIAISSCWALLHRSHTPGWPIRTNQYLRLMAHHGLPLKLVRALPWVLKRSTEVISAYRASQQHEAIVQSQVQQVQQGVSRLSMEGSFNGSAGASPALNVGPHNRGAPGAAAGGGSQIGSSLPNQRPRSGSIHSGYTSGASAPSSPAASSLRGIRGTHKIVPEESYSGPVSPAGTLPLAATQHLDTYNTTSIMSSNGGEGGGYGDLQYFDPGAPVTIEVVESLASLLESMVNLFAAMSHGDSAVKARLVVLEVINNMFGLTTRMPLHLQVRVLQAVRRLASDQTTLAPLEAANAIAYILVQLQREDSPLLQAEGVCALHSLCQLNRQRQEKVAAAGATRLLCILAMKPLDEEEIGTQLSTTARSAAVSILCSFAHAGPAARAELGGHRGIDLFLRLLYEEPYQAGVLEALASWLDADPVRVEPALMQGDAAPRLVMILPDTSGEDEKIQNIVSPLSRMVARSPLLAVALADAGLANSVIDLLKRPTPRTALALLELLRLLYENQTRPKEFIIKYRVQPTLAALARGGPDGDQVLVRKQAENLLKAFQVNTVF